MTTRKRLAVHRTGHAAEIAESLGSRARTLVLSWDTDPDAFVDAYDEVEAAGLIGETPGLPRLNALGQAVKAHLEAEP